MAQKVKKTAKRTYTKNSALTIFGKVLKGLVIFTIVAALVGSIFFGSTLLAIAKDSPDADIEKFLSLSSQSILLDDEGNQMDRIISSEVRLPVKLTEISQNLQDAFIATEDERFYEHHGVDYKRTISVTIRYAFSKLVGGDYNQGGSTLTQQLIKNIFLTSEKVSSRKVQEMYMALQIEKKIDKATILETYLNSIFLGGRAYGVEAAARQFFSKSANDLTIIESAYLAGVTTAPSIYYAFTESNQKDPTFYENRTKTVLDQMYRNGFLTEAEHKKYRDEITNNGIKFNYTTLTNGGKYNYEYFTRPVVSRVVDDMVAKLGITPEKAEENLALGGYKIYTTMNRAFQENTIKEVDNKANYQFKEYVDANGIIQPQVAAVVSEPSTGYVKALVGGRGEQVVAGPNRAASNYFLRAIGSATKPLTVYSAGIDSKIFDSATVFEDSPLTLEQREAYFAGETDVDPKDPTKPGNSYDRWWGYTNSRDALRRSSNLVTMKALFAIGEPVAESYALKYGLVLPPENYRGTSMYALGQYANLNGKDGANPMIMANAYSTFANNGIKNDAILYTKVVDAAGKVILENKPKGEQIIKPGTAYIMWDLLKTVVDSSTNISKVKFSNMPVAGKTGTTQDNKELWFVGTTPYYSAAVFIGSDDHQVIIDKATGAGMSSAVGGIKLWNKIMAVPHKDLQVKDLPVPNDIVKVAVSYDSGTLPTDLTRRDPRGDRTVEEWFFRDRVPKTFDSVHVEVDVNKLTGKLANFWTLPIFKEKRVYITRNYEPEVLLEDQKYVLPKEFDQGPEKDGYTVPATKPPVTVPPVTEPPVTAPPATEPPATAPPVTAPPVTNPPTTKPPSTPPPTTAPPVTTTPPPITAPSTNP
ncbi:MAG: transglycosylase domain-containing protein [Clostridiaceae bacterium]